MTRIGAIMLALAALVLAGSPAATAGETVLPFHATAQVAEDCGSQCSGLPDWEKECAANGYNAGFQAVRLVNASYLGGPRASSRDAWLSARRGLHAPMSSSLSPPKTAATR